MVRLSVGLNLSAKDLLGALDFYILGNDNQIPKGLRHIPPVNTERGLAFLALKKLPNGDCVFLKDNLCMVHVVRPSVCAAFPFVFRRDRHDMAWGLSAMKEICPGLGKGPEVPPSELVKLGTETLTALSLFTEFVQRWNERTREPRALGLIESMLTDERFSGQ